MQQTDSIATEEVTGKELTHSVKHKSQLHPYQVLRWLPKNATPEQQDSAIQANIKPSEIHWSDCPDTLHLPGQPVGKSYRDVSLPKYYKESFFSKNKFYHPELNGGRLGVAGDPVPYTIAGDNLITSLLLGCFILAMIAFAQSHKFIIRQAKNFFYAPRNLTTTMTETSNELRFQLFLVLQTCLLSAIIYFFYVQTYVASTFAIEQYQMIGIFSGIFVAYYLIKAIAYGIVNSIFFDKKKNEQWMKSLLFIILVEGLLFFPPVMLLTYFSLSIKSALIYSLIVVVLLKILLFYKTYIIFFNRKGSFLQNILYFCALEIVPLLTLGGVLVMTCNYLKINF